MTIKSNRIGRVFKVSPGGPNALCKKGCSAVCHFNAVHTKTLTAITLIFVYGLARVTVPKTKCQSPIHFRKSLVWQIRLSPVLRISWNPYPTSPVINPISYSLIFVKLLAKLFLSLYSTYREQGPYNSQSRVVFIFRPYYFYTPRSSVL